MTLQNLTKYLTDKQKVNLVAKRIKPQFPECGEGLLCFSIVEQALKDLVDKSAPAKDVSGAARYLSGEIAHAEICGVDSEWIQDTMKKIGLELPISA